MPRTTKIYLFICWWLLSCFYKFPSLEASQLIIIPFLLSPSANKKNNKSPPIPGERFSHVSSLILSTFIASRFLSRSFTHTKSGNSIWKMKLSPNLSPQLAPRQWYQWWWLKSFHRLQVQAFCKTKLFSPSRLISTMKTKKNTQKATSCPNRSNSISWHRTKCQKC